MMEKINEVLKKIPIIPIFLLYCGWVAYDYYDWMNSPQSPLGLKRAALVTKKKEVEDTKKKALAGEEFYRNLDLLRSRIRELTAQLENTKTVLSADVDIANFVSMITHEAKKLRITLKEIKPEASRKKEFYEEVPFTVNLRGAYVQMLILFDRISKFQQVIRVSDFKMKPIGSNTTKYVELDGSVRLTSFKYQGSHADTVIDKAEMKGNVLPAPVDPKKKRGGNS